MLDVLHPAKGLASAWLIGDDPDDVRSDLAHGQPALKRLAKIIEAEYAKCVSAELNIEAPEFAIRASNLYGQKAALTKLYRIVTGDPGTQKE